MNAPPWHQNMTGRLRPSLTAGVHTFSTRQFSLIGGSSRPANSLSIAGGNANAFSSCIARLPKSNASRTPVQGWSLRGAREAAVTLGRCGVRDTLENVDAALGDAAKLSAIRFDDNMLRHDRIPSARRKL